MRFTGLLYRALNPVHAREPLSGAGAARFGGRFNRVGRPALYTALAPGTALREANQIGTLQPTTMVAYRADIAPLFDGRDEAALASCGMTRAELADPAWRDSMLAKRPVPTHDLAETLIAQGMAGILVPSYARGAPADALNLVLWNWAADLTLIDDANRLGLVSGG